MAEVHHHTPRRTPKALRQLKPRISPPLLLEEATSESSSTGYIAANVTDFRQADQQGHHGKQTRALEGTTHGAPWLKDWREAQPNTLHRSLAGRNASQEIDAQAARTKQLLDWETRLKATEMELNARSTEQNTPHGNAAVMTKIHEALAKARTATDSAHRTLDYYRAELATLISTSQSNRDSTSAHTSHALSSMDAAIAAVADVLVDLASLEKENMEQFAWSGSRAATICTH
ncbi:hypothetical protein LTR37_015496 [Vermiconidia calcicola]|uniref:Uncharacterized protein n=1 Tax=Vermiconidia calcicola TaxID=1690605 RepID=A0ACC3MQH4_9PEZI|nr:hypothetical protein LTR37_015496 [Vermiconidia calcicola]